MKTAVLIFFASCHIMASPALGQENDSLNFEMDTLRLQQMMEYYMQAVRMDSLLNYQRGKVILSNGLATLSLDSSYKYLDNDEAQKILSEAWGNPPQETLGMIFPDSVNPYLYEGWGVILYYVEDGHIEDEDAGKIDYDELIETMQKEAVEESKTRREAGYTGYSVVGWAENPYYDKVAKKLYWAKELRFDESDYNTLNYDIRVLGRKGFLQLNAVAGVNQLDEVKTTMQDLLAKVEFQPGNTYLDFDPSVDQVAAYGIGALVAGKLAAKAGLIKVVGIFLAKFWKFILLGITALAAVVRKLWIGKEKRELNS